MIVCFSGTGNSRHVAEKLHEILGDEIINISSGRICADISDGRVIWVFPIHGWGMPKAVERAIKTVTLHSAEKCPHYMVCTCGDDTGNNDRQWHTLIESRGGRVGSIFSVRMPNTYVCFPFMDVDSRAVAERKLREAAERVDKIAEIIMSGETIVDIRRGAFPGFKSGVIYPSFFRHGMKASKFHFTKSCLACGKCIALCPNKNISAGADGRPQWGDNCAFCLRCYHVCSSHAVAYGSQTKKKGQYLHPDFQWLIKKFEIF